MDTPRFASAAVAAPHRAAVAAGEAILREGGNALEAMVAVAAAVAVVYPHMNGVGGDSFWTIREPSGRVRCIDSAGAAGSLATIARYREMGLDAIPVRGPMAALTVPGTVAGWALALDMAAAAGGRLPRDMLLHHAVALAEEGAEVGASEARYVVKEEQAVLDLPFFRETFLIDGERPKAGARRRQPALAATLRHLADVGLDDFFRGDVARELAADLARAGAPVTREDLRRHRAVERAPLSARMRDWTIHQPPPPSQGFAALMMLGVHDALGPPAREDAAWWHGFVEAVKRANALRDRVVTDFDRMPEDPARFLTRETFAAEAARIDRARAAPWPPPAPADGDTIWAGAIDRNGMTVSLIQSLFWEYGSGVVSPRTGVLMSNRGLGFSLDPGVLNALAPGRRPFSTLHAPLAVCDDGRIVNYGSMGGEVQPQIASMNFLRHARLGLTPAAALDAPRLTFGRAWGAARATVKAESRFDGAILAALKRMGHEVEVNPLPYADGFGHAGMLVRRADGTIEACHDPRADGGAGGV